MFHKNQHGFPVFRQLTPQLSKQTVQPILDLRNTMQHSAESPAISMKVIDGLAIRWSTHQQHQQQHRKQRGCSCQRRTVFMRAMCDA
jgi:hypothetical protein